MKIKQNGIILFKGPSEIDGKSIVVIATGINKKSSNAKTGDMLQTWIIREDIAPHEAIKTGEDISVCGDCIHRGLDGAKRSCYVTTHQAPLAVYKAYHRGNYLDLSNDLNAASEVIAGRMLRLGSYGDPAAVPLNVWKSALSKVVGWTGYTHQWRNLKNKGLKRYVMASADSESDRAAAVLMGWRTFRVKTVGAPMVAGEVTCPATTKALLSCEKCGACKGADGRKGTIVIDIHGNRANNFKQAA